MVGSLLVPKFVFFAKGCGVHRNKLESFELALRDAGIQFLNIVSVSSILPPHCEIIPKERGLSMVRPGQIVFCVMSENATNEPRRLITASVGVARPKDREQYGYIAEHHDFGIDAREASELVEDMSASMLASTLGIPFDPDAAWDERKQLFKMANFLVETTSISQQAYGYLDKNGQRKWTTVIAAAVMVL